MAESALMRLERIVAETFESAGPTGTVTITQDLANEVLEEASQLADELFKALSFASPCSKATGGAHAWVPYYEDVGGQVMRCTQCGKPSRPRRWAYPIR